MALSFIARSDFPPKIATIKLDSNATIAELKQNVYKALDLSGGNYGFFAIPFGEDVVELTSDSATLDSQGVKDKSTIILYAPPSLRPPRVLKKKENKKEEKVDAKDERDKYKGFTEKNALKRLETTSGPKKKLALEYIDVYAKDVFATPGFKQLPLQQVLPFVKRETLNLEEVELFEAVVEWAKAEVVRQGRDVSQDSLRDVLSEILPHIRFPVMSTKDIALRVTPTGLLSQTQVLELFTYLGLKVANPKNPPKLGKSLKFGNKPRQGRPPPAWFKWDPTRKHANLVISPDGLTLTSATTSYYQPVLGDVVLEKGQWEWEIVLTTFYSNTYSVNIGVVPASTSTFTSSFMIGYAGHMTGWAFAAGHGQKYHNSQTAYGRVCTSGDVVKVHLDLDAHTIGFSVNGQSYGEAYNDVLGPVRPAISLYGTNTVSLRFTK